MKIKLSGSFIRRAGWMALALLFILTGLGIGVVAFFQNTDQNKQSQSNQNQPQTCLIQSVPSETVLPKPEVFKPTSDVTQLEVVDVEAGSGRQIKAGDCLTVKYYGSLASGDSFDQNFDQPDALQFQLGRSQVIPGWDQGLKDAKVGSLRRLVIPSELAYGDQDLGVIPPNSDLVFLVKILDAK